MLLRTGTGVCYWRRSCIAEKLWLRRFMLWICPQFLLFLANDCISTLTLNRTRPRLRQTTMVGKGRHCGRSTWLQLLIR